MRDFCVRVRACESVSVCFSDCVQVPMLIAFFKAALVRMLAAESALMNNGV